MYLNMKLKMGVYWDEIPPHEKILGNWGELGRATLRLQFLTGEMESSIRKLKDLKTIYRLHHLVQSYYVGIFELRERLFLYVAALTKSKKVKDNLRNPNNRQGVYETLSCISKDCVPHLKKIIKILEDDVDIRNIHTHDCFLRLVLHNNSHVFDIEDLWWEHEEEGVFMKRLVSLMRKEGLNMVKDYKIKVKLICAEIDLFIKALIPYIRETGA